MAEHTRYVIALQLPGRKKPISYELSADVNEQVHRCFTSPRHRKEFVPFISEDSRFVLVRKSLLDSVSFLFEPPAPGSSLRLPPRGKGENSIYVYFFGRQEPEIVGVDEAENVFMLVLDLLRSEELKRFITIMDEDGEDICINARRVVAVDVPASLFLAGEKLIKIRNKSSRK